MTAAATPEDAAPVATDSFTIPLSEVERELSRQLMAAKEPGESPAQRARLSNVVIFCDSPEQAERLEREIPSVVATHPARVILLIGEVNKPGEDISASVNVWCQVGSGRQRVCSEQVTLRATGHAVQRLPFSVRGLLNGDLPTNLWWASTQPPSMGGALMHDLAENCQQVIYDSNGWLEPAKGVAATAAWVGRFEHSAARGQWRVVSDLNWRRLKFWRRILAQAFDPASAPDALETVSEVLIEHGPHAVVQSWLLVSWLASRLGWQVQTGRVQPGVEIAWQVLAPHGALRIRIRRMAEGASQIQHVRVACNLDGKPGALNFVVEGPHLAVTPEGPDASVRTIAIQSQSLADLVGRQLSDRERDGKFTEAMSVAQVFAQSVLG